MTWFAALLLLASPPPAEVTGFEIAPVRDYRVGDLTIDLEITAVDGDGKAVADFCGPADLVGVTDQKGQPLTQIATFADGKAKLTKVLPGEKITVRAQSGERTVVTTWQPDLRQLSGVVSILPPLLAVVLAIVIRQALLALFAGIWSGALFIHGYDPFTALLRCFDTYLPKTLIDSGHAAIILFTMALGGMVGIIAKSGGTKALVDAISARASSRRSGMVTAWASGLVVFFDDYANCLLVGNTVRPFTDKMRISREKLSYIVDSTAAPIATVALVSTWIGYQIGLLEGVFGQGKGYELFLDILPYSFYSFFTIVFVFAVAFTTRDFGPMARAERRALDGGQVVAPDAKPLMDREITEMEPEHPDRARPDTAVVPVFSVILIVVVGLYFSGRSALGEGASEAGLRTIIANADSYAVLLWASFGGSIIAAIMALWRRTIRLDQAMDAWISGVKSMVVAVLILVLAWALGDMCKDHLMTGSWILSQVQPSIHFLPLITFVVAALIALTTGSSFSTMAIVIPIAAPMAIALTGEGTGVDPATGEAVTYATLAAVLSGAVYGDHCSPISDTTIMSSMASACDHIDHVRTQVPYATLCAGVAAVIGFIPAGYGISPLLTVPLGIAILVGVLLFFGRRMTPADE
ncbi:MAG: Na+/H+ antiporter NhaC family protein [Proteobacteria bacterium]|nr:Na+/H+ antiporter NhaC family protein [Pseudomonadota bacterium]